MLVRGLVAAGHCVSVYDIGAYGYHGLDGLRVPVGRYDLNTIESDWEFLRDNPPDALVHLAGFSNDPTAQFAPSKNWNDNVAMTARIAEAAKKAGVRRFLYASSASIYHADSAEVDAELTERFAVSPHWHYAASKWCGERALWEFHEPGVFDVVVLRKGTISGPSFRMRYDLMLNTLYRSIMREASIKLHGGGWVYRPLLGIHDAVSAYLAVLDAPAEKISGQVFNVTSSNATVREYAEAMRRCLHDEFGIYAFLDDAPAPAIVRSYRISSRKFREQFGWQARDTAASLARELHLAFLGQHPDGILLPAFDDPLTENIRVIRGS